MTYQHYLDDRSEVRVSPEQIQVIATDREGTKTFVNLTPDQAGKLNVLLNKILVETISYEIEMP